MRFQLDNEIEARSYKEEDAEQVFVTVKNNYEHLRPFLHWVTSDFALEDAQDFIQRNREAAAQKLREGFGIFRGEKQIGAIGFVSFNWSDKRAEIGYWISKDSTGQGIITKACTVLINYAFDELEMNRIEIHCATENVKSCAVPERLKFKLEGILRQFQWRHTRFYDMAIYGLLKAEWQERKNN